MEEVSPGFTPGEGVAPSFPDLGKFRNRRIVLIGLTLVLFLIAGVYLSAQLKTSKPPQPKRGLLFDKAEQGELVGVFHQNGTAYFGKLVFEDEKTILLREVYTPAGFFPDEAGNLVFRVFKRNEGTPFAGQDYQIPKEEILFISKILSPKVEEAIVNYQPPIPAPTPTLAPTPTPLFSPEAFEESPSIPSPEPLAPSPESGFRVR